MKSININYSEFLIGYNDWAVMLLKPCANSDYKMVIRVTVSDWTSKAHTEKQCPLFFISCSIDFFNVQMCNKS
jgi:hypothetical protein